MDALPRGIDQVELAALAVLEAVPEAIARIEPVRCHRGIEDEASDFLGRPLRRQLIVRLGDFNHRRGRAIGAVLLFVSLPPGSNARARRSEEHTSELQSRFGISY